MEFISRCIKTVVSRRGFLGIISLGLYHLISEENGWARAEYNRVKQFLIRSIENTQRVDLKTWRLKIEGLVEKPLALRFDKIQALPKKIQVKNFICVEGWGSDNQKWEGVHLKEIFSKLKISPKAKYVTFHATGGKYQDSLSIQEALEQDTMLAYRLNGKDLPPENGFPLRLVIPNVWLQRCEVGRAHCFHRRTRDRILGKIWLPFGRLHPRTEKLKISLKPIRSEIHSMLTVFGIGQAMVSTFNDMDLFGGSQTMKYLPGLIHRDEFILLPMNHHAV